jgi:type I restriction enzyme M protein
VALLILAWTKVSNDQSVPVEMRVTPALLSEPSRALETLARFEEEGLKRFHVPGGLKDLTRLDPKAILPALDLALRLSETGLLQTLDPTDISYSAPYLVLFGSALPPAVASLLIDLADIHSGDTVYTPWDVSGQLSTRAAGRDARVYLETPLASTIPSSISLLAEKPFEVHHADPIRSPSAIESGKPRKFDVAIAFPPMNERYEYDIVPRDLFNRFREPTTSGAVLAVRHLLSQAHRRVVVAVSNSVLFSPGAEQALREELITRGMIEAVIAMPSGLLLASNISFAVMILDPAGGHERIKFINADSPLFRESISKAKCHLVNLKRLEELVANDVVSDEAAIIPNADVLANETQLQVSRYVVPTTTKQLLTFMKSAKTLVLGDIVNTVRPMPTTIDADDSVEALEVGASELPPFGYISTPGRTVFVERQIADKNVSQFLRPLDIVLIIKGSVGKVGIVPQDIPPPGLGGWVAGQSAIVLRSSESAAMDPRALALMLRSPVGQRLLSVHVSGASIPLIPLRELTRMQVLVPTLEAAQHVATALDQESRIQQEIDRLRHEQSEVAKGLWAL